MADRLLDLAAQALEYARRSGATSADAIVLTSTDISAGMRHGNPETIERAESRGLGLRVFVDQRFATLSTSDLSAEAMQRIAKSAVAIAKTATPDEHAGLADATQLATTIPTLESADPFEPSMEMLQRLAKDCEATGCAVAGITNSEGADAAFGRQEVALATSHGFAQSYASTHAMISCSLIAGQGETMERDYDYVTTSFFSDLPAPETIGRFAADRTLARMHPRKIASQQAPIFFDPRVSKSLLGALAGAISGSAITRGTSFLKHDLGKRIFAEGITITDDPLLPRGLGSHPFDAEGIAARKQHFVEDGVLKSWVLDCRNARQLNMQTTGHAQRGLASAPHPSTTNFYMHAGSLTPQQLLASVPHGFYVTETIGHGTNLITGDFSVGASGFWVENGEKLYPVSEVTIAGNLRDIYAQLIPANDLSFRYSTNAPTVLVPSMTIAGN